MNHITLTIIMGLLLSSLWGPSCKSKSEGTPNAQEIIVKFKPGASAQAMDSLTSELGLEKVKEIKQLNLTVFKITSKLSVEEAVKKCQQNPVVEYAEPNYTYHIDSLQSR